LVPVIAYFFYWAIIVEMVIYHKSIQNAFAASPQNWIGFIAICIAEAIVVYRENKIKDETLIPKVSNGKTSPWSTPTQKEVDPNSVKSFMHSSVDSVDDRLESVFNSFGQTRIYRYLFLKIKRMSYGVCVVLYVAMALMSLNDIPFLLLFVLTAYAFLENLLWHKHHTWLKRKHQNEQN